MKLLTKLIFASFLVISANAYSALWVNDLEVQKVVAGPGEYPNVHFTTALPDPDNCGASNFAYMHLDKAVTPGERLMWSMILTAFTAKMKVDVYLVGCISGQPKIHTVAIKH